MRICKLDTTSQIWGSGITDAQGNYGGTPSEQYLVSTFTISPLAPSGPIQTTTIHATPHGYESRTVSEPSAPSTCGAGCCADGTGWQ